MPGRGAGLRGEGRLPGLRVLADGVVLDGVISADVWSNNHLAADRFSIGLALQSGGLETVNQPEVRLELEAGFGGDWVPLVVGEADAVSVDPHRGLVRVEGRDLSALLIDSRVSETFANRTSSEIAETLAGRHGIEVSADATGTLVGRYYQSEHDRLTMGQFSRAMSEWDLLAYLAGREGFELFMDGAVLRFGAAERGAAFALGPEDCMSLRLDRGLGMARSIEVTVRSWDQRGGAAVVQTVKGGGSGRVWRHGIVRPNLPSDEAQRLAERALADLVRHEWTAQASMPGETVLTARHSVALSGTGTAWDRTYSVSEVSRHIDVQRGFVQMVGLQGGA